MTKESGDAGMEMNIGKREKDGEREAEREGDRQRERWCGCVSGEHQ